jgi:phospholipid-binding lipoprotein MlaA
MQKHLFFWLAPLTCCLFGLYQEPIYAKTQTSVAPTSISATTKPIAQNAMQSNDNIDTVPADEELQLNQPETGFLGSYNRNVSNFNRGFDQTLLEPTAKFYQKVLPSPVRDGIYHFFSNLNEIPTFLNDILQLHGQEAVADFWRFTINSTAGVGGLIDVAAKTGLSPHEEDFGLTLARWGYKKSAYFVIPFLGPSTIRDALSLPVNYYALSVWPHIQPDRTRYILTGLNILSKRAYLLEYNPVIKNASLNPFIFERNAYLQHRDFLIEENGQIQPEFFEEDDTTTKDTKK